MTAKTFVVVESKETGQNLTTAFCGCRRDQRRTKTRLHRAEPRQVADAQTDGGEVADGRDENSQVFFGREVSDGGADENAQALGRSVKVADEEDSKAIRRVEIAVFAADEEA